MMTDLILPASPEGEIHAQRIGEVSSASADETDTAAAAAAGAAGAGAGAGAGGGAREPLSHVMDLSLGDAGLLAQARAPAPPPFLPY